MSQERTTTVVKRDGGTTTAATNDEIKQSAAPSADEVSAFRARVVEVLDRRSYLQSRFEVKREGIHSEWCPDYPDEIDRKLALGFEFARPGDGMPENLNGDQSKIKIGDSILMVMPKWKHEIINAERQKAFLKINAPGKITREEQEYINNVRASTNDTLPVISEGSTQLVSGNDLSNLQIK